MTYNPEIIRKIEVSLNNLWHSSSHKEDGVRKRKSKGVNCWTTDVSSPHWQWSWHTCITNPWLLPSIVASSLQPVLPRYPTLATITHRQDRLLQTLMTMVMMGTWWINPSHFHGNFMKCWRLLKKKTLQTLFHGCLITNPSKYIRPRLLFVISCQNMWVIILYGSVLYRTKSSFSQSFRLFLCLYSSGKQNTNPSSVNVSSINFTRNFPVLFQAHF